MPWQILKKPLNPPRFDNTKHEPQEHQTHIRSDVKCTYLILNQDFRDVFSKIKIQLSVVLNSLELMFCLFLFVQFAMISLSYIDIL